MINAKRLQMIKEKLMRFPFFELLGRGRRGVVYKISPDLAVKIERDDISAFNTVRNEFNVLKRIGKYKYFPKAIKYDARLRFLIREYVKGEPISKSFNKKILTECIMMCYTLDKEGVNQEELTNPFKHIYVKDNKIMMIDFERARLAERPKNVSQFTQYLIKKFKIRNKKLIKAVKAYKQTYNKKELNKLLLLIKTDLIH